MSAVKKITEKRVYASGEKVFTKIGSGIWTAEIYNQSVTLERVHHDHWTCVVDSTKRLIGEGETRNEAMREAFYNEALEKGYDAKEADRLHWILIPQKYRSYGGHKPRRKTVNNTSKSNSNVVSIKDQQSIDTESTVRYAEDALERIQEALAHYKTSYNKVLGGWHYYKRDDQGNIEGGIKGPFSNEREMFKSIMQEEMQQFS